MSKEAAKTGIIPAAVVAIEQYYPEHQRGINDPFAEKTLSNATKFIVRLMKYKLVRNWFQRQCEKIIPGIWAGLICRKKYIDEKLLKAAESMSTVINLGAGFDSMFFRLKEIHHIPFYEIDQPVNINKKKILLKNNFKGIPATLKLIPVDFDTENLLISLENAGYSLSQKAFFIMEGLTQYVTEEGIKKTFDFLSKAPAGSEAVFTYVKKEFLQGKNKFNFERGYNKYVVKDKTWLFGLDSHEWPSFLSQYGWEVKEDIGYDELHETCIAPLQRGLLSTQFERIIHAVKI